MFLFKNPFRKRRENRPHFSFNVDNTNIGVGVWRNNRDRNNVTYRFKLSRVSDGGKRLTALNAVDVFDLPKVAIKLCNFFLAANCAKRRECVSTICNHCLKTLRDCEEEVKVWAC